MSFRSFSICHHKTVDIYLIETYKVIKCGLVFIYENNKPLIILLKYIINKRNRMCATRVARSGDVTLASSHRAGRHDGGRGQRALRRPPRPAGVAGPARTAPRAPLAVPR